MQKNLEHDQQASSELQKKELKRKYRWAVFKGCLTLAKLLYKACKFLFFDDETVE